MRANIQNQITGLRDEQRIEELKEANRIKEISENRLLQATTDKEWGYSNALFCDSNTVFLLGK